MAVSVVAALRVGDRRGASGRYASMPRAGWIDNRLPLQRATRHRCPATTGMPSATASGPSGSGAKPFVAAGGQMQAPVRRGIETRDSRRTRFPRWPFRFAERRCWLGPKAPSTLPPVVDTVAQWRATAPLRLL